MSDERVDLVLREASHLAQTGGGWAGAISKLYRYLKDHFPLLTGRAGAYTDAKVAQETGAAAILKARAELISARAADIRVQTEIRLADHTAERDRLRAKRDAAQNSTIFLAQAEELLQHALARAMAHGISLGVNDDEGRSAEMRGLLGEPIDRREPSSEFDSDGQR